MAATEVLLRAYLEAQSELGCEEVVLPSPLIRRPESAGPESVPTSSRSGAEAVRVPSPVPKPEPQAADGRRGEHGSPSLEGVMATLERALSEPARAREAAPQPRTEPVSLPDFPTLEAYWAHLAAHPGLAAGDPAATVIRVVRGHGPTGSALALAGLEPGEADAAAGLAFQGEPGILLAKMLKAIHLEASACYHTNLVKASRSGRPTRRDLARLLPWLHAELALARAPFVLLLGEACAQAVLKTGKTLEELRQEPFRMEGREFIATYHPSDLLAREELKRKAWEDLQWLRKRMAEGV